MPSSTSYTASSSDQCEHCHCTYTFIRRKKTCAVCRQSYCSTCAPRERNSFRVCLICQSISDASTTDEQLLTLRVKHLHCYLQAKNIPHHTCTEKRDLVDLVQRNRQVPFSRLLSQPSSQDTAHRDDHSDTASKTEHNPGSFNNFQNTMSSFASQMNHFAANVQDYVANTVSGVINPTPGGEQPAGNHSANTGTTSSFNFGSTGEPFNYTFSSPGGPAHTTTTASASGTSVAAQRARRKSLSEVHSEEKIEDLSVRELKEILASNFVDFKGCVEKNELLEKVRRLYRDRQNEKLKARELGDTAAGDTELCKICMDAIADCVLLDCGHMVTCVACGKLLAECPICRSNIVRVVRVFKS